MHPILFKVGNFTLYSYGLMFFTSFLVGIFITLRRTKRFGLGAAKTADFIFYCLLAVLVGSRLLYVVLHWDEFSNDLIGIIAIWRHGLTGLMFYGGWIPGLVVGFLFVKLNRIPAPKMLDAIMVPTLLGEGLTRIGCFLNGCCFGKPTASFVGVKFPLNSPAGATFPGQAIHPTQLYSSLAGFLLFGVALWLERRWRPKPGVLSAVMLVLYSLFRFGIDFVRYYENAANYWWNQAASLLAAVAGVVLLVIYQRRPWVKSDAGRPVGAGGSAG